MSLHPDPRRSAGRSHAGKSLEQALAREARALSAPPGLEARVLAALRAQATSANPPSSAKAPRAVPSWGRRLLAAAAVGLLALGLGRLAVTATVPAPPDRAVASAPAPREARPASPAAPAATLAPFESIASLTSVSSGGLWLALPVLRLFDPRAAAASVPDALPGDLPEALRDDPLLAEAQNLLSDASRAAEDFVRALPAPLRVLGRPR